MSQIKRKRRKHNLGLMALEPRRMFDAAAAHAAEGCSLRAQSPR